MSTTVEDVMSREVCTVIDTERLSIADDVMRLGRIRHLPVVDDGGKLVGILSQRDLFRSALARCIGYGDRAQSKVIESLRIDEVMTTKVAIATPDTPLVEAAQTMLEQKLGCLVVVDDDGCVSGILTESDFVKLHASAT